MALKSSLRQGVATGRELQVLKDIAAEAEYLHDSELADEVTHLSGRYQELQSRYHLGVIDAEYYGRQRNQLRQAVLDIIERLPDDERNNNPAGRNATGTVVHLASRYGLPAFGTVLLLSTTVVLAVVTPCPTPLATQLFGLLLALGAACVATALPGILQLEAKGLQIGSALGIFVLVYLVKPASALHDGRRCHDFVSLIVSVHGEEGVQDRILRNHGLVVIEFSEKTEERPIRENGEAFFEKLPAEWLEEHVRIRINHPQPYQAIFPDSLYTLTADKKVYLRVELKHLDILRGRIFDAESTGFLDSARVSIRSDDVFTDTHGWFVLHISPENRQKFQRVIVSKPGYETVILDSIPIHTAKDFMLGLIPKHEPKY